MTTQRIITLACLAAVPMTLVAPIASGQGLDRFWIGERFGSLSGDFNDPIHWLDGDKLGIPGEEDTAVFDPAGLYVVSFPSNQITDRVLIRSGMVTFDVDVTTYTLLNPLNNTSSIVIGETEVDTAGLQIIGGTLHGQFTDIGLAPGAFGTLTITGPTTQLLNDWQLRVGNQGAALLEISDGATAANGVASIAAGAGSFGDALVTGESTIWDCAGTLDVGNGGFGLLTISDGAQVISDDAIIAQQESSFGNVIVSGPGSTWTILGTLDVGLLGFGTLTIENGAAVTNQIFATVGTFPLLDPFGEFGGIGEVIISGSDSTWTVNGDLYLGFLSAGRWTLSDGGKALVNGDLFRGDWLSLDDPPQTIIELAASGDYQTAAMSVTGMADGFDPRIDLIDGFVPQVGDTFQIATADGGLGAFEFDLPELPPPLIWHVIQDAQTVKLRVGPIPGDLDGDGVVGILDLLALLAAWGPCPDPPQECPADLDNDTTVGILDLLTLLANWG
ncbi:MAG: hypothetical protein IH830_00505 [Planctomycetes bacterium]|nr:hypothetical protein [Planctomycetota bacterium]